MDFVQGFQLCFQVEVAAVHAGKVEGPKDAGVALAVIGGCLALPPTLFSVAAAIKDLA
jgi:fission process protein 1